MTDVGLWHDRNHRYIQMAGSISVLCGVCDDKWQDRYQQDTGEGERDD